MKLVVERMNGHRLEARSDTATVVVDKVAAQDGGAGAFRSVELLLAGLGTCMIGTMLTFAEKQGIPVEDVRVELKPLVTFDPERVSKIRMTMELGGDLSEDQLESLREAAESCKVHNTLHMGARTELTVRPASPAPSA